MLDMRGRRWVVRELKTRKIAESRRDSRLPHVLPIKLLDDSFENDLVVLRIGSDVVG